MEKEMATHSRVLAWRIPWTEKPGRLQSMGSHRVGHDWSDLAGRELDYVILQVREPRTTEPRNDPRGTETVSRAATRFRTPCRPPPNPAASLKGGKPTLLAQHSSPKKRGQSKLCWIMTSKHQTGTWRGSCKECHCTVAGKKIAYYYYYYFLPY